MTRAFREAVAQAAGELERLAVLHEDVPWIHPDDFEPVVLPGWGPGWAADAKRWYREAYEAHLAEQRAERAS